MAEKSTIKSFRSNFWLYGETGDRLSGIRESEVAKQSAKRIENMLITETGSLKASKQYTEHIILPEDGLHVIDTSFDFYLVIGKTKIMVINKNLDNLRSSVAHHISEDIKSLTIVNKTTLLLNNHSFDIKNGSITSINYLKDLIFPISNTRDVKADLWKKINVTEGSATVKEMRKMIEWTNPKFEVDADGKIYTPETRRRIQRVYVDFVDSVRYDDAEIKDGEYFVTLHTLEKVDTEKGYNVGNNRVEIGALTEDTKLKAKYFTTFTTTKKTIGELIFGTINDISIFTFSALFKNRLIIFNNDKIYFSRRNEYLDFRNSQVAIDNSEPFYEKPTPINGNQPIVLKVITDEGLYIITNEGVYICGFRKQITPFTRGEINIMTSTETDGQAELVKGSLYIMTPDRVLKCIQPIFSNVNISYATYNVDKYNTGTDIDHITKHRVEGDDYILATLSTRDKLYAFQSLNVANVFKRNTQIFPNNNELIGFRGRLLMGKSIFIRDKEKNVKDFLLYMNTPYLKTKDGGSYLNDVNSTVQRVVIKILNQDTDGIKKVKINGHTMSNLGKNIEDIYSLYDFKTQFAIKDGFQIEVETNENNKIVEIQGIDVFINVKGS